MCMGLKLSTLGHDFQVLVSICNMCPNKGRFPFLEDMPPLFLIKKNNSV